MSQAAVADQIEAIIRDVLEQPDLELLPATTAKDVNGWDSFKQIEILISLEQALGIKFSSADMDGLMNVGDLFRTVERKLEN